MRSDSPRGKARLVQNPQTKVCQPAPRHVEIKDTLAKHIVKMLKP